MLGHDPLSSAPLSSASNAPAQVTPSAGFAALLAKGVSGAGVAGAVSYTLTAAQGSYTLTGQVVGLLDLRQVSAVQGSYTLTGQAATLSYSGTVRILTAAQGSYTLTGQATAFSRARTLPAAQGSYTLTGQDATLVLTAAARLVAEQGSYTLTGQPAGVIWSNPPGVTAPQVWTPIRFAARMKRLKNLWYPTLVTDAVIEADSAAVWAKRNWPRLVRLRVKLVPIPLP